MQLKLIRNARITAESETAVDCSSVFGVIAISLFLLFSFRSAVAVAYACACVCDVKSTSRVAVSWLGGRRLVAAVTHPIRTYFEYL